MSKKNLLKQIKALKLVKEGKWDEAHKIVQDDSSNEASLVHAYLHRLEGDKANASYWYSRAGENFPQNLTLDEEWQKLFSEFCK